MKNCEWKIVFQRSLLSEIEGNYTTIKLYREENDKNRAVVELFYIQLFFFVVVVLVILRTNARNAIKLCIPINFQAISQSKKTNKNK